MKSGPPYPSPSEERAPRRRGGRGFYEDRGIPYRDRSRPGHSTAYRDRHRSPEDRLAAELARDLTQLAVDYPRFRSALHQLRHHVLVQVRSEQWKREEVLECVAVEAAPVEEIVEETGLDRVSVEVTLKFLEKDQLVEPVTRSGIPMTFRADGKPKEAVYWRRRDNRKSF